MVHVLSDLKHAVPPFPPLQAAPESSPHNPHNISASASDRRSPALVEQIDYNFPGPARASDGTTPVQIALDNKSWTPAVVHVLSGVN